jgi:5-methylcytosine-specific restriction endonuclease McrA
MRKDTKARDFNRAAKQKIADRDSVNGWPCCVNCGRPAPATGDATPLVWSNAHFISRAQMGRGVPENGLTLCPGCHRRYDQTTERSELREFFREYLKSKHPGWDESKLYYKKGE